MRRVSYALAGGKAPARSIAMEISKRLLVPYSAERMFDLIEAAEHYPLFMPWCAGATIVLRNDEVVVADIVVAHKGVRFDFRTRNPTRRPEAMSIRLERGPFRRFEGEWRLAPLGSEGCRIEFEMRYDFNSAVARLAGPVFDRITSAMVDAYVARADALYGTHPGAAAPAAGAAVAPAPAPKGAESVADIASAARPATTRPDPAPTDTTTAPRAVPPAPPEAGTGPGATNLDPPRSDPP
jgi:ribosome-associated toxin RatA of RatAB toxin-antitoxin module